jgi:[ribosomal protein S5]-alanine N-acetyltransferase
MDECIETARLRLRRPVAGDGPAIFARYASDPDVTRYMGWPRHTSVEHTRAFLEFSDGEWERWETGPLLVFSRADGALLGASGLTMETQWRAVTGYVLARDAWGRGYATEALRAMVTLAASRGVARLYATCHVDHRASWRVMEKCGFERECILRRHTVFPNLSPEPEDVLMYALVRPQRA